MMTVAVDASAGSLLVPMTRYPPSSCGPVAGPWLASTPCPAPAGRVPAAPVL
jgi:hypothetical protein